MNYQIMTDATADLTPELLKDLPPVEIIPMEVRIGGEHWLYGRPDAPRAEVFYELQRQEIYGSTTQIPPGAYADAWRPHLEAGEDILYLCFSSGLSGTLGSANIAAQELGEAYPDRRIRILDTLGASIGQGLLVREAAELQRDGLTLEQLSSWVLAHRLSVCHRFTVDRFDHLQHGGRVSPAAAALGTMLQIKPMLRVDDQGKLEVIQKPRGRKKAMGALIAQMEEGWRPELSRTVIAGHGGNPELGRELCRCVAARFPEADLHMAEIGPVIGAHTGPDMLALTYWGSRR